MSRLIDKDALMDNMFLYAAPEMMWDMADIMHKIDEMPIIELPKRSERYNGMVKELLELEERTKHFCLTSVERRAFQAYVEERLGV